MPPHEYLNFIGYLLYQVYFRISQFNKLKILIEDGQFGEFLSKNILCTVRLMTSNKVLIFCIKILQITFFFIIAFDFCWYIEIKLIFTCFQNLTKLLLILPIYLRILCGGGEGRWAYADNNSPVNKNIFFPLEFFLLLFF